jgi:ribulose 1,5-bisphosphate carboxylase large subunit-like protein
MRQSVDAVMAGIPLDEAAEEHEELAAAVKVLSVPPWRC